MALHLITGYAGREHITSADQGAYNIATFGNGNFVFDRGQKFLQSVLTNNSISISDGEAMMQGRYVKMPAGTTETVTIENGSHGKYRNDLICIRYEKSSTDATESAKLVVIKGTENTTTASDPEYNNGSITDGNDSVLDFPLYRVKLNGINIDAVDTLFEVKVSMTRYMKEYQTPKASREQYGVVKLSSDFKTDSEGALCFGDEATVDASNRLLAKNSYWRGGYRQPVFLANDGSPRACMTIKTRIYRLPQGGISYVSGFNVDITAFEINARELLGLSGSDIGERRVISVTPLSLTGDNDSNSGIYHPPVICMPYIVSLTADGFIEKIRLVAYSLSPNEVKYMFPRLLVTYYSTDNDTSNI